MYFLSDLDKTEKKTKIDSLSTVIRAYGHWIESLKTRMNLLETRYHAPAEMNINGCLSAKARMEEGLRILKENSVAWDAFSLSKRNDFSEKEFRVIFIVSCLQGMYLHKTVMSK